MLGIVVRKETKNKWERRTPLTPETVARLASEGIAVAVERSAVRVYGDELYEKIGATMATTSNDADVVVGIKEPPLNTIQPGQVHLAFAHVIKGQPYNMPLLKAFLERGATMIDYEPMLDDKEGRVAAVFSRFAGISGTLETLRIAALKLQSKGISSSLAALEQPWTYGRLEKAREVLRTIAPLTDTLRILIVGRGNVGQGCAFVCKELGIPELAPESLDQTNVPAGPWFAVVDAAEIVQANDGRPFNFAEYVEAGKLLFDSTFERYLGNFDILLQGAYWDERYPRQLPLEVLTRRAADLPMVIGDISCDIDGTLECTTMATSIDDPAYTFNVTQMNAEEGISWQGPTIMSIDNLPCELPADASDEFSRLLYRSIPCIANMDLSKSFRECGLSTELQRGCIVYKGELTPSFRYLERFL